jgi:hypothetical protein
MYAIILQTSAAINHSATFIPGQSFSESLSLSGGSLLVDEDHATVQYLSN